MDSSSGSLLSVATNAFRQLDADESYRWREKAVVLSMTEAALTEAHGKDGRAIYNEWITSDLGLSKATASRCTTVVAQLGESEGKNLPAVYQYYVAVAVKKGVGSASELLSNANAMPMHDFVEHFALVKPREKHEKVLACPECGRTAPVSEWEVLPNE
jgi:hypothetical protein